MRATGNNPVIVFVKSPEKGMVKSRLAAAIGDDLALGLYTSFVEDTLAMLRLNNFTFAVFFHPARSEQAVARWLGPGREILPQRGTDLGERMKNAFGDVFSRGSARAVLIGSDMPDLTGSAVREALAALNDHDAVIGPSYDGGYYLIGFRSDSFLPEAFDGISWSTPRVFDQTLGNFDKAKYRVYTLSKRRDIDTFEDLRAFFYDKLLSPCGRSSTIDYIRSHMPEFSRGIEYGHNLKEVQ